MPTGSVSSSLSLNARMSATGKLSAAGLPPAKLMRLGSLICLSSSRMMLGRMPSTLSE